ncbi:heme biosynthesis HemY N-terminal domain-containing protein [Pseudomonas sp. GCM10022188]|uniref:heme biosynthesis HemY N-terminal domain-containing protein n=1 Tax=Pseudomonas TaxID=286 RepID=UPI001E617D12|nr:heme biosynthesis HemY N-terminal domain-containing protein [Pseudomonas oryzagri]MCC6074989.1 heme biosynthesis protein HemY [Pseudomonas oryzagri]
MSRTFLLFLLVILAAALLGLAIADQAGYVLIAYKGFRYESTFWVFLAVGLGLWALLFGVRLLLGLMGASGRLVNPWSRRNRRRRGQLAAERGLLELAAGRWSRALRLLRRAAEHGQQPLVSYLAAARAASELGEHASAEQLLDQAREREPKAAVAIALARAQLLMARGADAEAVATLGAVREQQAHNPHALRLLQELYVRLENWAALGELLPELRRHKLLNDAELDALEQRVRRAQLARAAEQGLAALQQAWQQLPQAQRQSPAPLAAYAEQLMRLGAEAEAEEALRGGLKRHFDARLVELYGCAQGRDPARQLATAEAWLKAQPEHPGLLLALGRLALRNQLWGKARDYFEHSLRLERRVETYGELARLLARLGELERSNHLLQDGLGLFGATLPVLPQPTAERK